MMTELGSKIIKNEMNQDDNPDFAWILRDFELDVNDANRYLEEKLNKNGISSSVNLHSYLRGTT